MYNLRIALFTFTINNDWQRIDIGWHVLPKYREALLLTSQIIIAILVTVFAIFHIKRLRKFHKEKDNRFYVDGSISLGAILRLFMIRAVIGFSFIIVIYVAMKLFGDEIFAFVIFCIKALTSETFPT